MKEVSLYGVSGHALVIMDILDSLGWRVDKLYDDAKKPPCNGMEVFNPKNQPVEGPLIVSIGNNRIRAKIVEKYDLEYSTAIHPSAIISPSAKIGKGTVVMQGAIVQVNSVIGDHCIINSGASIDHECMIDDFVHISPHATLCGNVHVGKFTWVGAGSVIIQGIQVGENCIIGAGSVVIRDVPDNVMVAGNPARIIKHL